MPFLTTKLHETLLRGFRGAVITNCFSSTFNFGITFKYKLGITSMKKMESEF